MCVKQHHSVICILGVKHNLIIVGVEELFEMILSLEPLPGIRHNFFRLNFFWTPTHQTINGRPLTCRPQLIM